MSDDGGPRAVRAVQVGLLALLILLSLDRGQAAAQLGSLVSPGRLSAAHASLEGVTNCLSCHAAGSQVSAAKCLSCHKPVAERIARKRGVHRQVTTDCVSCHVEHAGANAELRPFDVRKFDHALQTGFALDGQHARVASNCAACHKTRSFLTATASCASCHQDPHKGSLGANCVSCHPTSVRFAEARTRFDHTRTPFPLTGRHADAMCASCHANGTYTRAAPATCASCHKDPHDKQLGAACTTCHTTSSWTTSRIDHARTAFPLRGAHATVACASCHTRPAGPAAVRHDTCTACHADPHRGTFKQDCAACHSETSFKKGTFDHSTTRFALAEGHAGVECAVCHKNSAPAVRDFKGLQVACASCHEDPHRAELGATCEQCHTTKTFRVIVFTHARPRAFFQGGHTLLRCEQCHVPPSPLPVQSAAAGRSVLPHVGLTRTATDCVSCHRDVHLGQVGTQCERCHAIDVPKFAVTGFSHAQTKFPLTGAHAPLMCVVCHKSETATFPAGAGTAVRLTGIGTPCVTCHADPHANQLGTRCEQCHTADTFRVTGYTHQNAKALAAFFAGPHRAARCEACHKGSRQGQGARGAATVVAYRITATCTSCHEDRHRGALGPNCETCHRLN